MNAQRNKKGQTRASRFPWSINSEVHNNTARRFGSPDYKKSSGSRSPRDFHGKRGHSSAGASSPLQDFHLDPHHEAVKAQALTPSTPSLPPLLPTLPPSTCTTRHTPAQATFALSSINILLQYVAPGSVVIFDIDDTLLKRTYHSSSLLSPDATSVFNQYLQTQCGHMSYDQKQQLVTEMGQLYKTFEPCEDDTLRVVQALQARGCYVFALTARSSTLSTTTIQSLKQHGIDFSTSCPPTLPRQAHDNVTGAVCINGIVYCNDTPKGTVFQRLLQLKWVTPPPQPTSASQQQQQCTPSCSTGGCTHQQQTSSAETQLHSKDTPCPEVSYWFVDDSYNVITSMLQSWATMARNQVDFYNNLDPNVLQNLPCTGKRALVCCHYSHPHNFNTGHNVTSSMRPPELSQDVRIAVINLQIHTWVTTRRVLTDVEALTLMQNKITTQQQQQQASSTAVSTAE